MIRQTLAPSVQRVERVAGKRRRHDPFMVRLVQPAVHGRVVLSAMDPVDAAVREEDEQRVLQPLVPREGGAVAEVVELGVAVDLGEEERHGENGHGGHGGEGVFDLLADLVGETAWVVQHVLVEERMVDDRAADEVHGDAEDPAVVS